MKRLADSQVELIDAWVADSAISEITPALLEKDIHVTDALKALLQINHPELTLVFCGGTSLSKAYGLIERMSEDVDLKVVPVKADLSRSALKRHLSELKAQVAKALSDIGLVEDEAQRISRDENRYIGMEWFYETVYETHGSLRPHLSIELTTRTPRHYVELRSIGYMLDGLLNRAADTDDIACVAPAETLAEKVLSFLRRYAQHQAGKMEQAWDKALVRHIYDAYCIDAASSGYLTDAALHFDALVAEDIAQFGRQFPNFANDPFAVLKQSLADAESDNKLISEYKEYLLPLIFGQTRPSYQEAFAVFKRCATRLLAQRPTN